MPSITLLAKTICKTHASSLSIVDYRSYRCEYCEEASSRALVQYFTSLHSLIPLPHSPQPWKFMLFGREKKWLAMTAGTLRRLGARLFGIFGKFNRFIIEICFVAIPKLFSRRVPHSPHSRHTTDVQSVSRTRRSVIDIATEKKENIASSNSSTRQVITSQSILLLLPVAESLSKYNNQSIIYFPCFSDFS